MDDTTSRLYHYATVCISMARRQTSSAWWAVRLSEAWTGLSLFESVELVARSYNDLHGQALASDKAFEIVAHIAQARTYFESALDAPELVRPLTLYYGVMTLARGLVLYRSSGLREIDLSANHGLKASWRNALQGGTKITDLPISLSKEGTFAELGTATQNADRVRVGVYQTLMASAPYVRPQPQVGTGNNVKLSSVLLRIPTLAQTAATALGVDVACFRALANLKGSTGGPGTLHIHMDAERGSTLPTERKIRSLLQLHQNASVSRHAKPDGTRYVSISVSWKDHDEFLQVSPHLCSGDGGFPHLIVPLSPTLDPSLLLLLYMLSYSVGMLVRYHPTTWFAALARRQGDAALPVLRQAVDLVEEAFPRLVLAELEAPLI